MAEQKVDDKEKLQLTLYNGHYLTVKHEIEIQRSKLSIKYLLSIAKDEMGLLNTTKIYRECGRELKTETLNKITNKCSLYLSDGNVLDNAYDSFNLCVMGAGAVGKSAVTLRFIQNKFVANYDPTIEDAYRKQVQLDGNAILLDILDTAGQEDFECLRTQWMKNKDAFILVFSIVNKTTFNALKEFNEGIQEVYDDGIVPPIILVGNKVDLDNKHPAYIAETKKEIQNNDDNDSSDDDINEIPERAVFEGEVINFAKQIGAQHYIETSAKTGYNVDNMVGRLIRHLVNIKYVEQNKNNKKSKSGNTNKKWWSNCNIL